VRTTAVLNVLFMFGSFNQRIGTIVLIAACALFYWARGQFTS
jgi:hypothetical protein